MKRSVVKAAAATLFLAAAAQAHAEISVLSSFSPGGQLASAGYDSTTNRIWVYASSGDNVLSYNASGSFSSMVARPGEAANDVDIEFAPAGMSLAGVALPAGTLLFINGETDEAEIYAVDKSSGAVLATLATGFGNDHVVGGGYHPGRDSFFLVQDRVAAAGVRNRVAEISVATGAVLNEFSLSGLFDVNFGDLDVSVTTGNLLLVSSIEDRIAELTPSGALVQYHALPSTVVDLSGIGIDGATGQAWASNTSGRVYQLGNVTVAAIPEPETYALLLAGLGLLGFTARRRLK